MTKELILSDAEITLRPFRLTDAETHLEGEDKEQIKWLSGGKSTLEGVEGWIKKNQKYWDNDGPTFNFAVTDSSGKLIGMVEANSDYQSVEGLEQGDANLSYGIYPDARGHSYASKAVLLLIDFLKDKGFKRAVIRVSPENKASAKVPEKCGFELRGTVKTEDDELVVYRKEL